jgi:putative tricarboxylic transport membrane protein
MARRWRPGQELCSGAVFVAVGAAAVLLASRYQLGTPAEMGPGFFPTALGALLILLGAANLVRSWLLGERSPIQPAPLRAVLIIPMSALAFALLIERAGLALAVAAAVLIAALAARRFRPVEAIASAVALAAFTSVLFVYLLDLPLAVLPPW